MAKEVSSSETAPAKSTGTLSLSFDTSSASDASGEDSDTGNETIEHPEPGTKVVVRPLERAPENVFEITKTLERVVTNVEQTPSATVTTKKTIVTSTKGWRNVYSLPISYDVNMVPNGTLLDPTNPQLLEATGIHPEGYNRRFAVIDAEVNKIYGDNIRKYFEAQGIELSVCVLPGGEPDKRPAVRYRSFCGYWNFICISHIP